MLGTMLNDNFANNQKAYAILQAAMMQTTWRCHDEAHK